MNKDFEKDLSIIVPFCGEHPQVLFTLQSMAQDLLNTGIDFEIIAIDNHCPEVVAQAEQALKTAFAKVSAKLFNEWSSKDFNNLINNNLDLMKEVHRGIPPSYENRSGEAVEAAAKINPWLEYMKVEDTLSHWECKRRACERAKGKFFLFVDAHTVPARGSIYKMVSDYNFNPNHYFEKGTFHLPLTYKILETHKLIYKMKIDQNFYGYAFTGFREEESPYEVPCMSTCGMLISRQIYEAIGGWPKNMTMYGGGENYMNYTLSVCGYKKWIYPHATLFHHGDKRDYHYTYDGMLYNRMVAHYLFGGLHLLKKFTEQSKGQPAVLTDMVNRVLMEHKNHRSQIRVVQKMDIEEWVRRWRERGNEKVSG